MIKNLSQNIRFILADKNKNQREGAACHGEWGVPSSSQGDYMFKDIFFCISQKLFLGISSVQQGFNDITVPFRFFSNSQCIRIFLCSSFIKPGKLLLRSILAIFTNWLISQQCLSNFCQIYFLKWTHPFPYFFIIFVKQFQDLALQTFTKWKYNNS